MVSLWQIKCKSNKCVYLKQVSSEVEEGMDVQDSSVQDSSVQELGHSGWFNSRSTSSQSRDRQKILEAANHDPAAVYSTAQHLIKDENKDAAKVLKRLTDDPSLGEPLAKCLKKMDSGLKIDEDGEKLSPISSLAYLLGFFAMFLNSNSA